MAMSRKHYEAIAAAVKRTPMSHATRKGLAYDLASTCAEDSPSRFDPVRFVIACGLPDDWAHETMLSRHSEPLRANLYLRNLQRQG